MVWDVAKGKGQGRLTEHGHYVQGVAWDPAQQHVVSQSADRTCRQAFHALHRCHSSLRTVLPWPGMQRSSR